ncbi:Lethal(3)malignant brain tumor-like protein 3, partial [Stegodyphus mimosarum]
MAVTLPSSSVATTTISCLSPQLPLISLRETVAKINMPAVVQASVVNPQVTIAASTTVSSETVYNLTISNGEIHSATSSAVPKIAVPPVAALAVSRDFKNDPVTTTSQKPIIVTVSGMPGMTAGKQLTSATNVLTAPLLSAPVHMIAQHFTTEKIPSSGIMTLPTLSRTATNVNPILSAKPRQTPHISPLIPTSIIASKGQLVIASANSPLIGSSTASVITTMSGISLNSSIVTVTPVIMTSTAPLVSLPANSAMTLNPVSQTQVLSTMIQPNVKPPLSANNKTIIPATYVKSVNIAANPPSFPVAVQPAAIAPAAIAITPAPPKEPDVDPKCDPKNPDFDPIQAMEWKDGIATLPGSNMKFKLNEFGTLEMITEDLCNVPPVVKSVKDEGTTMSEDSSSESRQKTSRSKEMYQDENSVEKVTQNGPKDPDMSEELCRCENCNCFGLKVEFCKSGRFCSQSCVSSYANRKNAWLKRGAAREKIKKKKVKTETNDENVNSTIKNEETGSEESLDLKKEFQEPKKGDFSWEEYLKQENAIAAPVKLFKDSQGFPTSKNSFEVGMKLEGIDPKHPSLFCVLTVSETRGHRVRLHFDGYSECYDFWVNADSPDIFPVGWCEKTG